MKGKIKIIWETRFKKISARGTVVFLIFIIGITSTVYLFKSERDIQNLYERRNSLDVAFAEFLGLHSLTQINPWQGLSDEYLQWAYKNYYFSVYENYPSNEALSEVNSRAGYQDRIIELSKITEANGAKNKISDKIKEKQLLQLIAFLVLISSQIVGFLSRAVIIKWMSLLLVPILIIFLTSNFTPVFTDYRFSKEQILGFFSWPGWTSVSAMVLGLAAIFIMIQASATKRQAIATEKTLAFMKQPYVEIAIFSHYSDEEKTLGTHIIAVNTTDIPTRIWTEFSLTIDGKTYDKDNFKDDLGTGFSGEISWADIPPRQQRPLTGDRFNFLYKITGGDPSNANRIKAKVDIYLAPPSFLKPESESYSKYYKLSYNAKNKMVRWETTRS